MINNIQTEAMVSHDATIVRVTLSIGPDAYVGTGSAKKHPVDRPNPHIGLALAYTRALREIVDQLIYASNEMIEAANERRRRVVQDPETGDYFAWEDLARRFVNDIMPVVSLTSEQAGDLFLMNEEVA